MLLLVPSDPLRPSRPDSEFSQEAKAARDLGWNVGTVDIDELVTGRQGEGLTRNIPTLGQTVAYRGWMLRSEAYVRLAQALEDRGARLVTNPENYRRAHEFPGWYSAFLGLTPDSVWTADGDLEDIVAQACRLPAGPLFVKDWVKSMKHYWPEAAVVVDSRDTDDFRSVLGRFLELRGADLVGGLVLRTFESFAPGEYRSWWVNGRCTGVTAHPDSPDALPPADLDLEPLISAVEQLACPFITADLAVTVDGNWRVVEIGDGQVSGRPTTLGPHVLLEWLTPLGQSVPFPPP